MENLLSRVKSIGEAVDDAIKYIDGRRHGTIRSLKTRWDKLNEVCMGGIEPNAIYTFAGISASGKSAIANMIESDILSLNPEEEVVILSFSFEMLSSRQVSRKLSNKLKRTTRSLYSINDPITDSDMDIIKNAANSFRSQPIYYVDTPMEVTEIEKTIQHFQKRIGDKWLVVILDHTLLLELEGSQREQDGISELQKVFLRSKKIGKTTILQLSQMNREIEKPERINNPMSHFPMRSDISTSDKVYHASDYVFVIHRPETLGILHYGKEKTPTENIVFLHLLKNREGDLRNIAFKNELMYNNLVQL